jgi:hypothetical protein
MNCISVYSSDRAYKMEAENGRVDFGQSVGVKVMRVEGEREAKLPRVLPELSWEGSVDEGANFSVKAVCGVKNKT